VRAHKPMYANNTRGKRGKLRNKVGKFQNNSFSFADNGQITFPTGSNLPLDLRNCTDTYCTQVPNYPSSFVAQLLRNQGSGFHEFFGEDVVISQNISQRFDNGDIEETLCQSTEVLVFPKLAQTRDDQWKLVVNEEQYKQGVRVERCL
jgi:Spaetzle